LICCSMAFLSVRHPRPFIIDASFLDNPRPSSMKRPSFAMLKTLMQQDFRDTSQIHDFLDSFRDRLKDERTAQLSILDQQRADCSDEETVRAEAITEGTQSLAASQSSLNTCTSELDEATHLRDLADSANTLYAAELTTLENDRLTQISNYNNARERLVNVGDAIDQTLDFVDQLQAESAGTVAPSFVQMTNKLLQATIKTGHSHMVLPVYTTLLQMKSRAKIDDDTIQQVEDLLNQLRESALLGVQNLDSAEATNLAIYNDNHDRLTGLIAKLTRQVDLSNSYIGEMTSCIAQETSISTLSADKISRNQDLLDQSRVLCQLTEDEFTAAELARTRQLSLINALDNAVTKIEGDFEAADTSEVADIIALRLM